MESIKTEADYQVVTGKIDALMAKGSENVSTGELAKIRELAVAAQEYEQHKYGIDVGA